MVYKVGFTRKVLDYLDTIDQSTRKKILGKINFYIESGDPLKFAKRLEGDRRNQYRFRIGNFRVIFQVVQHNQIIVLLIGDRKDIYG